MIYKIRTKIEFTSERTMLKSRAHQKFFTLKPEIILSTSKIIRALITRRKSPKVNIVIGIVKNIKTGFIIAFTKAMQSAVTMAVRKFLTETPFRT